MLTPLSITGCLVVYPCQELEVIDGDLRGLDAELLIKLADRRTSDTLNRLLQGGSSLPRNAQWVRATSVRPHIRECDLLGGALLKEESVLGVEKEDGESAVEESLVDVLHQVACGVSVHGGRNGASLLGQICCLRELLTDFLAGTSDRLVVVV